MSEEQVLNMAGGWFLTNLGAIAAVILVVIAVLIVSFYFFHSYKPVTAILCFIFINLAWNTIPQAGNISNMLLGVGYAFGALFTGIATIAKG